jgi:hypothetical protein
MKLSYCFALIALSAITFVSCKKDSPAAPAVAGISALNCSGTTFSTTAVEGVAYTGTATVPYTGGNAIDYTAGTAIASTGVTGLTATLSAGTLANGVGNLTYTISGTPSGAGNASFALSFAGQNCALTLVVSKPYTGKWAYQYIRDTVYNWAQLVYNNTFVVDSVTTPQDVRNSTGYFQFNSNNTYTWKTTGTAQYNGSFSATTNNGYAYGTTLNCLGISTAPAPNDTTKFYIYKLQSPNMTLNRLYGALTANNDTIVIDRYYELLKQ